MTRYIDADEFELELLKEWKQLKKERGLFDAYVNAIDACIKRIKKFPTADVQEVKHGKWIVQHRHVRYPSGKSYDVDVDICPFCGRKDHNGDGLYCGYCGAMMDLE